MTDGQKIVWVLVYATVGFAIAVPSLIRHPHDLGVRLFAMASTLVVGAFGLVVALMEPSS